MRASIVAMALLAASCSVSAQACPGDAERLASLRVTPGEFAGPDRSLSVELFEGGCVRVHRPSHYRNPGDFELQLKAEELDDLRGPLQAPGLMRFDADGVRQAIERQQQPAVAGEAELFEVLDADRYELLLGGGPRARALTFDAVFQYARRYAEVEELGALAQAVDALQNLAEHPALQRAAADGDREGAR